MQVFFTECKRTRRRQCERGLENSPKVPCTTALVYKKIVTCFFSTSKSAYSSLMCKYNVVYAISLVYTGSNIVGRLARVENTDSLDGETIVGKGVG